MPARGAIKQVVKLKPTTHQFATLACRRNTCHTDRENQVLLNQLWHAHNMNKY